MLSVKFFYYFCAVLIIHILDVALLRVNLLCAVILRVVMLSAVAPPFIIFFLNPFLCRQAEGDREGSLLVQTEKNGALI